jgi:hypothetical protein
LIQFNHSIYNLTMCSLDLTASNRTDKQNKTFGSPEFAQKNRLFQSDRLKLKQHCDNSN